MNLVELTEYLVKQVVANPDMVTVKEFPSENEKEIVIEVLVDEADIGRVIGKGGKTANAIRVLVQANSYLQDNKRVKINIEMLKEKGVIQENIIDSKICTVCNSNVIHSYRGSKKNNGLEIGIIELK